MCSTGFSLNLRACRASAPAEHPRLGLPSDACDMSYAQHHAEGEVQRGGCCVLRKVHPPAAHHQHLGLLLLVHLRQGAPPVLPRLCYLVREWTCALLSSGAGACCSRHVSGFDRCSCHMDHVGGMAPATCQALLCSFMHGQNHQLQSDPQFGKQKAGRAALGTLGRGAGKAVLTCGVVTAAPRPICP